MATASRCDGTDYLPETEAAQAVSGYPAGFYGRKVCTKCHGAVFVNANGKLRKHKAGSNSTT